MCIEKVQMKTEFLCAFAPLWHFDWRHFLPRIPIAIGKKDAKVQKDIFRKKFRIVPFDFYQLDFLTSKHNARYGRN